MTVTTKMCELQVLVQMQRLQNSCLWWRFSTGSHEWLVFWNTLYCYYCASITFPSDKELSWGWALIIFWMISLLNPCTDLKWDNSSDFSGKLFLQLRGHWYSGPGDEPLVWLVSLFWSEESDLCCQCCSGICLSRTEGCSWPGRRNFSNWIKNYQL